MSNRMYRTALGKQVDMGSLLIKNEDVRAVGNMGVNAKGDIINEKNITITPKAKQVNHEYKRQIQNQIVDIPIGVKNPPTRDNEGEISGFDTPLEVQEEPSTPPTKVVKSQETKKGGLASAIAKAREVEQKKIETPREKARKVKGVKKI